MRAADIKTTAREQSAVTAAFRPITVLMLLVIGIMAFGAYIALSGFEGDLERKDHGGRAHALSKSPNGFAGIVRLLRFEGRSAEGVRTNDNTLTYSGDHLVVTVPTPYSGKKLEDLITPKSALIVMPKWRTRQSRKVKNGTVKLGLYPASSIADSMETFDDGLTVAHEISSANFAPEFAAGYDNFFTPNTFAAGIDRLQTFSSKTITPIITVKDKGESAIILGRYEDSEIYILSDPDLLNNSGLKTYDGAVAALEILNVTADEKAILFDLTLHGLGSNQNLVKTMLTPPFLAATLCLLATGLMLAWRAFTRFGRPQIQGRIYASGKQALADNSADMIRLAGREPNMAPDYANLTRKLTANALGLPKTQSEAQVTESLDRMAKRGKIDARLTDMATRAETTNTVTELMTLAQRLNQWRQEMTHDRK